VKAFLVVIVVLAASGCGRTTSCDNVRSGPNPTCWDIRKDETTQEGWRAICTNAGGTNSDHPCDLTNIVAGCRDRVDNGITTWWYASDTIRVVHDVEVQCVKSDLVLVTK
jgi:hypothetical protein